MTDTAQIREMTAVAPARATTPAPVRMLRGALVRYWPILLILIAWPVWLWVNGYSRAVAPSPLDVVLDVVQNPEVYLTPVLWTLLLSAGGLVLGMLFGIALGVLVWTSSLASGLLMPSALVLRVVPVTAMIPILARLFGYGSTTVLVIVVILVFFPAFSLTISGMSSVGQSNRDLFGVLGSGLGARVLRLHLPAAIPHIMLALRLSAPIAILGVLLAEYLMSGVALGGLIRSAGERLEHERAWAAALLATVFSVVCFGLARLAERKVVDRMT